MAQSSPLPQRHERGWDYDASALPAPVWLRWVCAGALVALLVWLGIASWGAEGDRGCAAPTLAD